MKPPPRRVTGIAEFDRVTGGGIVPGSALLIGGDPGVGKSTLILQALAAYAQAGGRAVYISGEEAMAQVRLRAARMGVSRCAGRSSAPRPTSKTSSPRWKAAPPPDIVAIDSIQTIWTCALEAAPGTIAQVRTASFDLVRYAKVVRRGGASSSAMSPRTARSRAPRRSSIWSMPCSISKASAAIISASCAR